MIEFILKEILARMLGLIIIAITLYPIIKRIVNFQKVKGKKYKKGLSGFIDYLQDYSFGSYLLIPWPIVLAIAVLLVISGV